VKVLPVQEATAYIKDVLAADPILQDLWIHGEVSNLSQSAAGHIYFTIKDEASQLRCVLFRHQVRWQSYTPRNGAMVVVHGNISLYEASGALQVYVDLVHDVGVGAAFLAWERLRQQLAAEGLFDESRKRPLPAFPRCIGVVTSAQGAVWHDIVTIVGRRYPVADIVLSPALVQGADAPASIVQSLRRLWALDWCDVIIVGRGGGSAEDLGAFNDEMVARAIYASPVPVISAVGHEVDVTIADFVADMRAPTPSAAAELVVPDREQLLADVGGLRDRLSELMRGQLADCWSDLDHTGRVLARVSPRPDLRQRRQRLDDLVRQATAGLRHRLTLEGQTVAALAGRLQALDPSAVLARGYAVVTDTATNRVVQDAASVQPGERLRVQVSSGHFGVIVEPPEKGPSA
jgi:exodeoxyribonuclease VII large subunit